MKSIVWSLVSVTLFGCGSSDKGIAIHNTPPVVSFTSPTEGEAFELGATVEFWALVEDKESGPEDLELEWVSDLEGLLEEGTIPDADGMASYTTNELEEGVHTITIKATDFSGRIGEDYMTIRIESNCLEYVDCDDDGDGFTEDEGDCDDADDARHPDAEELYNGIDDDCDGIIDEGTAGYDDDGDGYTEIEDDCDDNDESVYPGAEEIPDGIDNDCDDLIDEGTDTYDDDGDGYSEADGDCDDTDPEVSPEGIEVFNGIDDDCDGLIDEGTGVYDDDGDGYAEVDGDCDDTDPSIHPLALEECDEIDNDCDGDIDEEDLDTDRDEDGYSACDFDCDDEDPDVHPDAPEICDEIDNDCDEEVDADDPDTDMDEDGYGICDEEADCNDDDDLIFPGAGEICDPFGEDEDCDGEINEAGADGSTTFYLDADGDGYGSLSGAGLFCSAPEGYADNADDCDDALALVNPDGTEVCGDGLDNDCDGGTDADDPEMDQDGDGSTLCDATPDCNDDNDSIYPGGTEVCDLVGVDEDCDGEINEADADGSTTFYVDADGDGYGSPSGAGLFCSAPEGYAANADDCDDALALVNPDGTEVCGDGLDNDCDGGTDADDPEMDQDGDGSTLCDATPDCNDDNDSIYPGGTEVCDLVGVDEDCDGEINEADAEGTSIFFADVDGDGYGTTASFAMFCSLPASGYADNADDCDDTVVEVNPGAEELCDDDIDNDCDGAKDGYDPDTDADGDGYSACAPIAANVDCDDTKADIYPGGTELCGDGIDNDCDGAVDEPGGLGSITFYEDADEDGYGNPASTTEACTLPAGFVTNDEDCNDSSAAIKPGATEVCDGVDNDCNGDTDAIDVEGAPTWYYDGDDDGFGSSTTTSCAAPVDHVADGGDCNDGDSGVYPGATEYCDGKLNDCDLASADGIEAVDHTQWYRDFDGDGYPRSTESVWACDRPDGYRAAVSEWDCDDTDPDTNAGSSEVCGDGEDNDCDLQVDEPGAVGCDFYHLDEDGDGYGASDSMCLCDAGDVTDYDVTNDNDCYDDNANAKPGATSWRSSERGDGSFDYSCDGDEEHRWPSNDETDEYKRGTCELASGGGYFCGFLGDDADPGWYNHGPECGEEKYWYTNCRWSWDDWKCVWSRSLKTQQCR